MESPIPVAVDDAGRMKAQVRAGKWTVRADAFRLDNPKEFRYAPQSKPAADEELVAFRAKPDFRVVEIAGAASIDVSQTTFPQKWRDLPVYRWDTATPFRLEERMRGMGEQKPEGLRIAREWWLDEGGHALTFRDRITGQMQQIWRLDAAAGQDLGSVRSAGHGQLITRNPQTAAPGVEIRTRNLDLEATGRMARAGELAATGWRADADALNVTLNLPPGWRLFALFGADWVKGDWLTVWTLLDLFLLLIFSLAVLRLWGFVPALLALIAFGLSYHEPGAPRYAWVILLVPLALLRVVPEGTARKWIIAGKWLVILGFILVLAPFVAAQVQQALYPQLEQVTTGRLAARAFSPAADAVSEIAQEATRAPAPTKAARSEYSLALPSIATRTKENLAYDTKAQIQTGPGVPEWKWRQVSFGWNGPVSAAQQIKPVLISLTLERTLTIVRVALLVALAAVLLRRRGPRLVRHAGHAAGVILLLFCIATPSLAQTPLPDPAPVVRRPGSESTQVRPPAPARPAGAGFPDGAMLKQLRERLLKPSDAYPHAADLPFVTLKLDDRRLTIDAEIHAAIRTAVPLPGRLPSWSPVSVTVDDKPEVAMRRDDGFLWLVLEPGVHRVRVDGTLANLTEWEWTFALKPRQVKIEAPSWNVSGVRPDGVPEAQVFFARKQKAAAGQASYDREDYQAVVAVDRHLELGLIWQVRTTVTRLSPVGKALSVRLPLLPGENVLSSNAIIRDGSIEVRLGAQEQSASWESGLAITDRLKLATRPEDTWVERWHLIASPVWNVAMGGLPPIFESGKPDLVPLWQPWPGESVELAISRPEAIAGATVTVDRALHSISLGKRQRVSKLEISVRCSVGQDFPIELPADAEVTSLTQNDKAIPARKDGSKLIVPLHPGEQRISVGWKINAPLERRAVAEEVRLPVESANIRTTLEVPGDRWVLWAFGPTRGPAVRFWGILVISLLAAAALGRVRFDHATDSGTPTRAPLSTLEWMLLAIGLTQVPLAAALIVVGWLFFLAWRGTGSFQRIGTLSYNALQILLVLVTVAALGILLVAVGEGLLGRPEMFITGNDSSQTTLNWLEPRAQNILPQPGCLSISIWWYRFFMLAWALWLAAALIRWLRVGWQNFGAGGFSRKSQKAPAPPPLPTK